MQTIFMVEYINIKVLMVHNTITELVIQTIYSKFNHRIVLSNTYIFQIMYWTFFENGNNII